MIRPANYHSRRPVGAWLAAHPAHDLLEPDLVQAPDDVVGAHPENRQALPVEVFPLLPGDQVPADGAVLERHAELAEEICHRGGLLGAVPAIEDGVGTVAGLRTHIHDVMAPGRYKANRLS